MDEPIPSARAAWSSVREQATGLTHHEAKAALRAVQHSLEESSAADEQRERRESEEEEWQRIVETLADHDGPYDPASDPFVQGELAGQQDREAADQAS
ncbi:hypothetical protein ACFWDI_08715 [Streptomyces sp. NPDC060064]|uniref:hypothetical protein n=1 Tax=Streptomyces sp. NPDC060064 TaxID=3347049 RepID=UPI0036C2DC77